MIIREEEETGGGGAMHLKGAHNQLEHLQVKRPESNQYRERRDQQ